MNSVYSLLLTVILVEYCVMFPLDNSVALSNTHSGGVKKARSINDKTNNELLVGNCTPDEPLIHAETIVVNNDGRSRLTGNIRVNVEAPVNITCVKLLNQADNASGVPAHLVEGGVGHNYVVFGVDTAFGQGIHYFVQIFGV